MSSDKFKCSNTCRQITVRFITSANFSTKRILLTETQVLNVTDINRFGYNFFPLSVLTLTFDLFVLYVELFQLLTIIVFAFQVGAVTQIRKHLFLAF